MELFNTTLNQMAFLFLLILIGYGLRKSNFLPDNTAKVLSKLENAIFIPALVLRTFVENFTIEKLASAGSIFSVSLVIAIIMILVAIGISKCCTKDRYIQKIFTYGLAFSNFGFMGNAVVSALFPNIFFEYLIFTLPLWSMIYIWGVPTLLLSETDTKQTIKDRLRAFVNPMLISMLVGMIIGIAGIKLPGWFSSAVSSSADCMSPIAMLLTGITVAASDLKKILTNVRIYIVSVIRLIVIPLIFIGILYFVKPDNTLAICAVCSVAMPLGLNTIVIPNAYGKDTTVAAGMAVISHLMSCITIPLIFMLMMKVL